MWSQKTLPIVPIGTLSAESSRTPRRPPILQQPVTLADCVTSAQHWPNTLHDSRYMRLHPTQYSQHMLRTNWGQNGHSASPNVLSSQEGSNFYPQQRKERRRKKKTQDNAASRKASRRIARAPRLSCLYKQALIFLSSSGTSAIYSQTRGRGPAGLQKFSYSPVRPSRPVCENRFHL